VIHCKRPLDATTCEFVVFLNLFNPVSGWDILQGISLSLLAMIVLGFFAVTGFFQAYGQVR